MKLYSRCQDAISEPGVNEGVNERYNKEMAGAETKSSTVFIDADGLRFSKDRVVVLPSAKGQMQTSVSAERSNPSVKRRRPVILQMTDYGTVEKKTI